MARARRARPAVSHSPTPPVCACSPPEAQERWFAAQVDLAERLGLPLFLHCRDAGRRFADILRWVGPAGPLTCCCGGVPPPQRCSRGAPPQALQVGACAWRDEPACPARAAAWARRERRRSVPACIHCFTGSRSELEEFLELDLFIGGDRSALARGRLLGVHAVLPRRGRLRHRCACAARRCGPACPQALSPALAPQASLGGCVMTARSGAALSWRRCCP